MNHSSLLIKNKDVLANSALHHISVTSNTGRKKAEFRQVEKSNPAGQNYICTNISNNNRV